MSRAVFFEEDDARAVAAYLLRAGFATSIAREPFAGEDDDEDHPWAVRTEAPVNMLEIAADSYDGWVDHEPTSTLAPLDLPAAPKRSHRPE